MLLLALDTSTRQASIALCSEDELYGEYTWQVGNNHSVELLTMIQQLLSNAQRSMSELDAIAVALGPGSFNGLRVATATAKALAFALQKPLVGVRTLDIIAAQQRQWRGPIGAFLEAGRSEVYLACYVFDEQHTLQGAESYQARRLSDYLLLTPEQAATYLKEQASSWVGIPGQRELPPFLFCGEISPATRQALTEQFTPETQAAQPVALKQYFAGRIEGTRRASVLAQLAFERLREGPGDDPLRLEPFYLRRPSITTSARKQPLLGEKASRSSKPQSETERGEGALRH